MGAFYTEHDAGNLRVGFATALGTKSTASVGLPPTEPTPAINSLWHYIRIIFGVIESIIGVLKSVLSIFGL